MINVSERSLSNKIFFLSILMTDQATRIQRGLPQDRSFPVRLYTILRAVRQGKLNTSRSLGELWCHPSKLLKTLRFERFHSLEQHLCKFIVTMLRISRQKIVRCFPGRMFVLNPVRVLIWWLKLKLRNWGKEWKKTLLIRWIINPAVPRVRVVQKSDSVIHRINRLPEDKNYGKQLCLLPFEQCLGIS